MIPYGIEMAGKKSDLGPTGIDFTHAVRRQREKLGLSYAELSRRLAEIGRDIPPLGLRRLEAGTRRADVDDLVALAAALGVSPSTLLMPLAASRDEVVEVTGRKPDTAEATWDWLRALQFRGYEDMESLAASNPPWAVESVLQITGTQRAQRRIAAGVPHDDAHTLGVIRHGDD